jgi:hypothetical protein
VYFYFDFNDEKKQSPAKMIRSLITQLSSLRGNTPQALKLLFSNCGDGKRQPTVDELLTALRQIVQEFDELYIILDALDECKEREELLVSIEEITGWKLGKLHILATSRGEKEIEESLGPFVNDQYKICIQSALVNGDIRTYIHERLQTDRRLKRWAGTIGSAARDRRDTDGQSRWNVRSASPF